MIKNKKNRMVFNVFIGVIFLITILTFYSTFSMDTEYSFQSLVYEISDEYVEDISPYTEVGLFYQYFDLDNCSIEVVDNDNRKIVDGYVVNGSKTILYDTNNEVLHTYINIIKGDYVEDGVIDSKDFKGMGKCLVDSCNLEKNMLKSVDINGDGSFKINDLVLLDKAVTLGYKDINIIQDNLVLQSEEQGRLVAKVTPNYGINQRVEWSSLDNKIVTVDRTGRVTGHQEGETKVRATTLDGKLVDEVVVKVDNTIQLLSYEGIGYIGGDDLKVGIKLIDYDGVTCLVGDEQIADCEIKDKKLILKAKKSGNTNIVVTSPKYGSATYKLTTHSVYLTVMPDYYCESVSKSRLITVSGFYTGNLSFKFSDQNIIKNAYMTDYSGRNMLRIDTGDKAGRATLSVHESNGNTTSDVVIDVYKFSIPQIGTVGKIGVDVRTDIIGENLGQLSCVLSDDSKATCRIENNQLVVTPLMTGAVTIDVYNKYFYNDEWYSQDCGHEQFMVLIQE